MPLGTRDRGGTGDQLDVRRLLQQPGECHLHRARLQALGDTGQRCRLQRAEAAQREEGHIGRCPLGQASARELAANGANLVLGARRLDRLLALAEELSLSDEAAVQTDVVYAEQVKRLVDRAVEIHGRVDVIINNAGVMPQAPLERLKIAEWDRTIDVNIKGVLYGIAAALPHMIRQKSGHIINVSSVAGHRVGPGGIVYSATKHAVRVISEGLRQEVTPHNIRTTIISPGAVATELPATSSEPDIPAGVQQFFDDFAIPADSFARCVTFAMSQPEDMDVNETLFRPTKQEV